MLPAQITIRKHLELDTKTEWTRQAHISRDGKSLAIGFGKSSPGYGSDEEDAGIAIWDIERNLTRRFGFGKRSERRTGYDGSLIRLLRDPDLVLLEDDGFGINRLDLATGSIVRLTEPKYFRMGGWVVSEDFLKFIYWTPHSEDRLICHTWVYDLSLNEERGIYTDNSVLYGSFWDEETVVLVHRDGSFCLYDMNDNRFEITSRGGDIKSAAISPNGRWIALSDGAHMALYQLAGD